MNNQAQNVGHQPVDEDGGFAGFLAGFIEALEQEIANVSCLYVPHRHVAFSYGKA